MICTGQCGHFHWLVATCGSLPSLTESVVRSHPGLRLCITACDGGPIRLNPEELAEGWVSRGTVAASPPLAEISDIPRDQYDEWYLLDEPPSAEWQPEVFVNYGGFTLVPANELNKTWNRPYLDWFGAMQGRFWEQMDRVNPVSYVATGDHDVVVSRRPDFIERLRDDA